METKPTFYSRHRERCLAYQHTYNATHKAQRKEYDHARYLKKKANRIQTEPPAVTELVWDGPIVVKFD